MGRVDRFIVGTGRCGSTLLSKMIRENDEVASLFEYFSGLDPATCFSQEPLDGDTFAAMHCDTQTITNEVLARGYPIAEVCYPFDAPGSRYSRRGGLPFNLAATIPSLPVEDPDAFYDEARAFMLGLPARPAGVQHRAFFDWITERLGRSVWVERSGGSIDHLAALAAQFPGAQFLHLHRAGEEAALSMREHHVFRLGITLRYRLPVAAAEEGLDRVTQLLESFPPCEYFGRAWTEQLLHGFRALRDLDADQYWELRFEDLVDHPQEVLREIAEFLALPNPHGRWLDRAAALVHGAPPTRADRLPDHERERLAQACRPGNVLLGRRSLSTYAAEPRRTRPKHAGRDGPVSGNPRSPSARGTTRGFQFLRADPRGVCARGPCREHCRRRCHPDCTDLG